jgi:hypothetical protein
MLLEYERLDSLPPLAWCARVDQQRAVSRILAGSLVECHPNFFVEGAWHGTFEHGDFALTETFFGSGGTVRDGELFLVTSSSTTSELFYCNRGDELVVSNSLPFLLAATGDRLDPQFFGYAARNESVLLGIDDYQRTIPTQRGSVTNLVFRSLRIGSRETSEVDKPMPPRFHNYAQYRAYLADCAAGLTKNARDPSRTRPMAVASTQSRGYDTTAVNAVFSQFGIDQTFTVTRSKGRGAYVERDHASEGDDDGTEIASLLGIPVVQINRRAFEGIGESDEHILHASQHGNQDANLLEAFHQISRPSLLLTGVFGEVWATRRFYCGQEGQYITPALSKFDLGGHGLGEVRLEYGFVDVPFPYLGARRRRDIYDITHSPEMVPWRLDNDYDRPIARRMAEDAGVPRQWFGQLKMASVVETAQPQVPWNAALRREFYEFMVQEGICRPTTLKILPAVHWYNERLHFGGVYRYYLERVFSSMARRPIRLPELLQSLNGSLYCYAVNRRAADYRDAATPET